MKLFFLSQSFNRFKIHRLVYVMIAVVLLAALNLSAQPYDVRCSPYLPDNTCLDMSLGAQTQVTLPENHTRIETDGINICMPPGQSLTTTIDIVFVIDQSGSMESNDQEFFAPAAVREAIDTIRARSPNSSVGFLGFANGICNGTQSEDNQWSIGDRYDARGTPAANTLVPPAPLTDPQYNALAYQTGYGPGDYYYGCGVNIPSGTYYGAAFQQALTWLQAPGLDPNRPKIIIFVTDGAPHPGHDTLQTIFDADMAVFESMVDGATPSTFPRVYSIFIGGNNTDLTTLANNTNGRAIEIEAASELADEINIIIEETISANPPQTTVAINGVTKRTSVDHNPSGSNPDEYNVIFDNVIPLAIGLNSITITTTTSAGGVYTTLLPLDVSGPVENRVGDALPYENIDWQAQCEEATKITFTLPNGEQNISLLDPDQNSYEVHVTDGPSDQSTITLTTDPSGQLTVPGTNGTFSTLDTLADGTRTYTFQNENDPRDVATSTITKLSGPEIATIVKHPSDYRPYIDFETQESHILPDTLIITFTEPLGAGDTESMALWSSLILYSDSATCMADGYASNNPSFTTLEVEDVKLLDDGSYQVLISGERGEESIQAEDCAVINPEANLENLTITPPVVKTEGEDSEVSLIESGIVSPVIGAENKHFSGENIVSYMIPVIDDNGDVVETLEQETADYWIPPIGLTSEGEIDEQAQLQCTDGSGQTRQALPYNCLSKVAVYSQAGYSAAVSIVDHLGKVVHSSRQRFGMGGCTLDILADGRLQPAGYLSFLVWNQRNLEGSFVGSGVYIWKVRYKFADGAEQISFYKQGVVRQETPDIGCHTR